MPETPMFMDSFRDGWFRSLTRDELPELVAHWKRLSAESLRRRFLRPMRDADLEAHARKALGDEAEVIGWYHDGVLRGVSDIYLDRRGAEAAFSVESGFRGRGIGKRLLAHALRRARNRGCQTLMIMTTRENTPMIRIARHHGARLEFEGSEVIGYFDLKPASLMTHIADLSEEEAGVLTDMPRRMGRMIAAWLPETRTEGTS